MQRSPGRLRIHGYVSLDGKKRKMLLKVPAEEMLMQHPSITTYYSRQLVGPERSPIPQNEVECQQSQPVTLRNSNLWGYFSPQIQ